MYAFNRIFMIPMAMAMGSLFSSNSVAVVSSSTGGGTVTFSGAVTSTTCNWQGSSPGNPDLTVQLSPVTRHELGITVGLVDVKKEAFNLQLVGECELYPENVSPIVDTGIYFTGSNVSEDQLYLKNEFGSARGVGIALTSNGSTILPMNKFLSGNDGTTMNVNIDSSGYPIKATLYFYAHYYNYGGATISSGSVITNVIYYLDYY